MCPSLRSLDKNNCDRYLVLGSNNSITNLMKEEQGLVMSFPRALIVSENLAKATSERRVCFGSQFLGNVPLRYKYPSTRFLLFLKFLQPFKTVPPAE